MRNTFAPYRGRRRRSFVLLEVTIALVILGVSMGAVLRGFMIGFYSLKEIRLIEEASLLAETMLEDYELEPPPEGDREGFFVDDPRFGEAFANYEWVRDVEEEELRYSGEVPRDPLQELEPLYRIRLEIWYDDGESRRFMPIAVETYLLDTTIFSQEAIQANQLF